MPCPSAEDVDLAARYGVDRAVSISYDVCSEEGQGIRVDFPAVSYTHLVGDQAAHERENVDRKVKYRIDNAGVGFVEPEFGHQEQGQNRHHRVETEPFPHVGQRSRQQSLRMVFEHSQIGFMSFGFVSIRQIYDKIFVYIARSVKFA